MKIWVYINPENNILCCALLEESIPANVETVMFDGVTFEDIIYDGTQIRLKTNEEKLQEVKQKKLTELKNYTANLLSETDYIIVKISEAQVSGDTTKVENLKQKYSTQLQERDAIRSWNEQMKLNIKNAQSTHELINLAIKFDEPSNA